VFLKRFKTIGNTAEKNNKRHLSVVSNQNLQKGNNSDHCSPKKVKQIQIDVPLMTNAFPAEQHQAEQPEPEP
jgi:hypothetical protein